MRKEMGHGVFIEWSDSEIVVECGPFAGCHPGVDMETAYQRLQWVGIPGLRLENLEWKLKAGSLFPSIGLNRVASAVSTDLSHGPRFERIEFFRGCDYLRFARLTFPLPTALKISDDLAVRKEPVDTSLVRWLRKLRLEFVG